MKNLAIAGLIAIALTPAFAGCRPDMRGMMQSGMMQGMSRQSGEKSDSNGMTMGPMSGKGMMSCCNEQCPVMKGKS